jgi:hypothetical protein
MFQIQKIKTVNSMKSKEFLTEELTKRIVTFIT